MVQGSRNSGRAVDIEELRDQVHELTRQVNSLSLNLSAAWTQNSATGVPLALPVQPRNSLSLPSTQPSTGRYPSRASDRVAYYGAVWKENPQWNGIYTKYQDYSRLRPGPTYHKKFYTPLEAENFVREKSSIPLRVVPLHSSTSHSPR